MMRQHTDNRRAQLLVKIDTLFHFLIIQGILFQGFLLIQFVDIFHDFNIINQEAGNLEIQHENIQTYVITFLLSLLVAAALSAFSYNHSTAHLEEMDEYKDKKEDKK